VPICWHGGPLSFPINNEPLTTNNGKNGGNGGFRARSVGDDAHIVPGFAKTPVGAAFRRTPISGPAGASPAAVPPRPTERVECQSPPSLVKRVAARGRRVFCPPRSLIPSPAGPPQEAGVVPFDKFRRLWYCLVAGLSRIRRCQTVGGWPQPSKGGEVMRITFHLWRFTVTILVKSRNRHSHK
jgi:hypothetical protein